MKNYKQLININIDDRLKAKGFDEKYFGLINEYFKRYQYEFQLNPDELEKKIDIVLNNIDKIVEIIEVGRIGKIFGYTKYGLYDSKKKLLGLNNDRLRLSRNKTNALDVIFHELNHAGEDGSSQYTTSFEKNKTGVALNEIITEMKSSRLAKSRIKNLDSSKHVLKTTCYGQTMFCGSMIHAALGMSETEFLKATDLGREKFDSIAKARFSNPKDYELFMDKIIFNTDMLHSIMYNTEKNGKYSLEDVLNMTECTSTLYEECLLAMSDIIPNQVLKNKDNIDITEYAKKCRYFLDKLNANYSKGIRFSDPKHKLKGIRKIYKNTEALTNVKAKILAIEAIGKNKDKLNKEECGELLSQLVGKSEIVQTELEKIYSKCGMNLEQSIDKLYKKTNDRKNDIKFLQEDYGTNIWDNNKSIEFIKQAIKREPLKKRIERKRTIKALQREQSSEKLKQISESLSENYRETSKDKSFQEKLSELTVENPTYEQVDSNIKEKYINEKTTTLEL